MALTGLCKIKQEFILPEHISEIILTCVSKTDIETLKEVENEPVNKKQKLSKADKRKLRGQNKARPTFKVNKEQELCNTLINVQENTEFPKCNKIKCNFMHDIQEYLKKKPNDIGSDCYNFTASGNCTRGLTCRFSQLHVTPDGHNKVDHEKQQQFKSSVNQLSYDLQNSLRKRLYDFSLAEAVVKYNDEKKLKSKPSGVVINEDVVKLLDYEKRKIDWKGKLFLSPLTTVGNLPFRRICKSFGADVTCGEMAMCSALLQGAPQEWALVKRHHSEDIFGVQLCANNPYLLTKCGQMLQKEIEVDFIDLNLGCPIELVYKEGGGCGLLRRPKVLEACVSSLSHILTIPLTVKTRTGVYSYDNVADQLIPKFSQWGASLVTLHGRSREQRYTKLADWDYIKYCAQQASPLPVLGNGDILNYEDYKTVLENCPELAGVMIGRGALIKPWIFTEIKEQKLWDICSSERFDIIKTYVNYGLEHWGSDTKGVENTRRFLLEWLSFLYRYVPVGLLENPPQKMNERPVRYKGRNDLETLMASSSASDWIKISEMLLGPVPEGFVFLPKHKANAYT